MSPKDVIKSETLEAQNQVRDSIESLRHNLRSVSRQQGSVSPKYETTHSKEELDNTPLKDPPQSSLVDDTKQSESKDPLDTLEHQEDEVESNPVNEISVEPILPTSYNKQSDVSNVEDSFTKENEPNLNKISAIFAQRSVVVNQIRQ